MSQADYQLRHQLYGQQGTLWERQVDATTARRIRRIVKEAGNVSTLTDLDQIAASAVGSGEVSSEDMFFHFQDGNFVVVGQEQRDYTFRAASLDNGSRLHFAYRSGSPNYSTDAIPAQIALLADDFLRAVTASTETFSTSRDWYLVPIPFGMVPHVILGKGEDVFLVNGIDFVVRDGYIAMPADPASVLPNGLVRVCSGRVRVFSPNSFVLSAPTDRPGGRFLSDYVYKSQSLETFKRAAAEYSGMFVVQGADVVVSVHQIATGVTVYNLANAGAVTVNYNHTPLKKNQELPPGYIVGGRFDLVSPKFGSSDNLNQAVSADWDKSIRLDGILPVNGLTWDGRSEIAVDSVASSGGIPHLRLHFDGATDVKERFWEFQRLHEDRTQTYLYTALGASSSTFSINFWDFLSTFYGSQLCLALFADHSPVINVRMRHFLAEHHPQSCNILVGSDMGVDESSLVKDNRGIPLLDEFGNYFTDTGIPTGPEHYQAPGSSAFYRARDTSEDVPLA